VGINTIIGNQMSRTNYPERLRLAIINKQLNIPLYSISGELLASSYTRIVIGERGPYIECLPDTIIWFNFYIPTSRIWKADSDMVDYVEYRSNQDNVKLYLQKREVNYATYKINYVYLSPFDVYFDPDGTGNLIVIIEKLKKNM